jgi:hypothetical protein
MELEGYPGGDLIDKGLADLARGEETVEALLVLVGEPRLLSLGISVPGAEARSSVPAQAVYPEHRLYALLAAEDPDSAHGRYNALIRRLVSFERSYRCSG